MSIFIIWYGGSKETSLARLQNGNISETHFQSALIHRHSKLKARINMSLILFLMNSETPLWKRRSNKCVLSHMYFNDLVSRLIATTPPSRVPPRTNPRYGETHRLRALFDTTRSCYDDDSKSSFPYLFRCLGKSSNTNCVLFSTEFSFCLCQ